MLRTSLNGFLMSIFLALAANVAVAATDTAQLEKDAKVELQMLYEKTPEAKALEAKSKGILVFPSITRAGIGIGGHYGKGVLIQGGKVTGYYSSTSASIGLQLGIEKYGYAMFLQSDKALKDLKESHGFEVGSGPTVVVVDKGAASSLTTATAQPDVYAFIFDQKGLMAGITLQGSKISQIDK